MKSALRTSEQRVIEIARRLRYGVIEGIRVRNGELVLGPTVKTRRRHRVGKADAARHDASVHDDFKLKNHHLDLVEKIRRIENGVVSIEVQDGLPIDLIVEEDIGV